MSPFRTGAGLIDDRTSRAAMGSESAGKANSGTSTLSGSGQHWFDPCTVLNPQTISNRRPPPTPVGGGWPTAGRGFPASSKRMRGPQAQYEKVMCRRDWSHAQPSTVSPSRPVGALFPKSGIWWRASLEGLWWAAPPRLSPTLPETSSERALRNPTLKGTGHQAADRQRGEMEDGISWRS